MPFIGVRISELRRHDPAQFSITYRHRDYGSGRIVLAEDNLRPVARKIVVQSEYPKSVTQPTISFEGMRVKMAGDQGASPDKHVRYVLRWETLGAHHDRPRKPPLPPPSVLTLLKLQRAD